MMADVCRGIEILNEKGFRDINTGDRILMGPSYRRRNVALLLAALETVLKLEGYRPRPGALEAAGMVYGEAC